MMYSRVNILCEGQSEEIFVKKTLSPYFSNYNIYTPLYKFFNKKSIVQDFLMYNEFATTITKESDPVR